MFPNYTDIYALRPIEFYIVIHLIATGNLLDLIGVYRT